MTLLDIVSEFPGTEAVLEAYNDQVGECICCTMLFETLERTAAAYGLDLNQLLAELNFKSRNVDARDN